MLTDNAKTLDYSHMASYVISLFSGYQSEDHKKPSLGWLHVLGKGSSGFCRLEIFSTNRCQVVSATLATMQVGMTQLASHEIVTERQ